MTVQMFHKNGLVGGTTGKLDNIDVDDINDGDKCLVNDATYGVGEYEFDSTYGDIDEALPGIVKPDLNLGVGYTGNGRWILQKINAGTGVFYPELYGAVGDGATDDTVAMTAVLAAMSSGDVLYITSGKTFIVSSMAISTSIKVVGTGTIKQKAATAVADTPFIIVSANNVKFDGIIIDGNATNQGVTGADLIRVSDGVDCTRITNNKFMNSTGYCISAGGVDDIEISKNTFNNWRAGAYAAIYINNQISGTSEASNLIRITDNYINGATSHSTGIALHGTSTYAIYDSIITGNNIIVGDTTSDTLGIELWSSAGAIGVYNATVSNNIVSCENTTNDSVWGISLGGAGVENATVSGNTVYNCRTYGIEIAGSSYVSVVGNSVWGTTAQASATGIILNNANKCSVTGNTVKNYVNGITIYMGTATETCNENVVSSNTVEMVASTAGSGIFFQCNHATGYMYRNYVIGNMIVGDGTASQYGIGLQLDAGTFSDTYICNNVMQNLPVGISRDSEVNTTMLWNCFDTVTTSFGGTGGAGEMKFGYDPTNTTVDMNLGSAIGLSIGAYLSHGQLGAGAATNGFVRMVQDDTIQYRNEAGDADITAMTKDNSDKIILGDTAGIGVKSALYIGDGAATNIQAPVIGTGDGPTTAVTVVKWIQIDVSGTVYYIPLMQ